MPVTLYDREHLFASELLGRFSNADTLDGLHWWQFMRRDETTWPTEDLAFDLGTPEFRWKTIYANKFSTGEDEIDLKNIMRKDQSNYPTKDNVFDLGSKDFRWRNIYAVNLVFTDSNGVQQPIDLKNLMRLDSHNIPTINNAFDLGNSTRKWRNIHASNMYADNFWINGSLVDAANIMRRDATNIPTQNATFDLGSNSSRWRTVYAQNINIPSVGNVSLENLMLTNRTNVPTAHGSYDLGSNTMRWRTFYGVAIQAQYADLAEKYTCKNEFPVGTLMSVSQDKDYDIDLFTSFDSYIGVVSENPGFLLNSSEDVKGQAIALKGKVKVRVVGKIKKGDFIIPDLAGVAKKGQGTDIAFKIGTALESSDKDGEKLILCIV